jgi:pilus assembly protein CpaC
VRPEVSELTQQGAVQISAGNSAIQVPALTVRRADTTVELGSGQSFAIAGLLQYNASTMASYVPLLGDVPVLGELFRSNGFQRNETELVIIVTPYLIEPVSAPSAMRLPGDTARPPGDIELMLGRRTGRPQGPVAGDAGFELP